MAGIFFAGYYRHRVAGQDAPTPIATAQAAPASCADPQTLALGAFNMEDFNDLKYWSTPANGMNGQSWLIGNMRHDPGLQAHVPYDGVGGPDACEIALIKAWVDAGTPNN